MEILIDNRQTKISIDQEDLRRKTERILEDLVCEPETLVSISVVNAEEMADLNFRFRGKSGPTNVLSFAQHEGQEIVSDKAILGDVVICSDRVVSDADELGYTYDEMLLYLLIHGILHLQGYDHDSAPNAEEMAYRVEELFQRFCPAPALE